MDEDISQEELSAFAADLSKMLKPRLVKDTGFPLTENWVEYFRNLHETGECYVAEEFLTTIIPSYHNTGNCPALYAFQATCHDAELLARLKEDRFEWSFSESMIMEEIRRQGFDPILHPCHIAWMIQEPGFNWNRAGMFYVQGADGGTYSLLINSGFGEDSQREHAFFTARQKQGDEGFCPSIQNVERLLVSADGTLAGDAFVLVNPENQPMLTFFASRPK